MLKSAIPVDNPPYVFGYMVNNGLSLGDKTKKKMIKASELRIGNIVSDRNMDVVYVIGINPTNEKTPLLVAAKHAYENHDKAKCDFWDYGNIHPIPLTSDWLIRFGFFKYNNAWVLSTPKSNSIKFEFSIWQDLSYNTGEIKPELKYVHQLQNFFFSLMGKELVLDSVPTSSTAPDSTTAK